MTGDWRSGSPQGPARGEAPVLSTLSEEGPGSGAAPQGLDVRPAAPDVFGPAAAEPARGAGAESGRPDDLPTSPVAGPEWLAID